MKSYWGIANFLSLGNAACGVGSVFQSISHHFQTSALLLVAAVLFDFLDGKSARFFGQASLFGKGLDCLSDCTSFGIAPAVLGFLLLGGASPAIQTVLIFFVLAGAWRLAYFFQWGKAHRPPGMPITMNGLIFPLLVLLQVPSAFLIGAFGLSTLAMVLPIFLYGSEIS